MYRYNKKIGLFIGDKFDDNDIELTEEEYNQRKQKEFDALPYDEKRRREYPSIGDQLDYLYHADWDGWRDIIRGIKEKYPKPTE